MTKAMSSFFFTRRAKFCNMFQEAVQVVAFDDNKLLKWTAHNKLLK